ncbi:hypothetical protein E2C01_018273 [Portunus trituberculatus]|uniref:Secreted protein n=1 Tax=Portunus trituberculatus TaxID=210409 RepID=A0A5B7DUK8_PORTR|nr:hypothetical protein [Portunus trituberculatus]
MKAGTVVTLVVLRGQFAVAEVLVKHPLPSFYYCIDEISCVTEIYSCFAFCENLCSETAVTSVVT